MDFEGRKAFMHTIRMHDEAKTIMSQFMKKTDDPDMLGEIMTILAKRMRDEKATEKERFLAAMSFSGLSEVMISTINDNLDAEREARNNE